MGLKKVSAFWLVKLTHLGVLGWLCQKNQGKNISDTVSQKWCYVCKVKITTGKITEVSQQQ